MRKIIFKILVITGFVLAGWVFLNKWLDATHLVSVLYIENGKTYIKIVSPNWCEHSCPLSGRIYSNNAPVTDTFGLGNKSIGSGWKLEFKMLKSTDGNIVALTEKSNPNIVLMAHEFSSGFTYPSNMPGSSLLDKYYNRANTLILQIDERLLLSHQVSGGTSIGITTH